jgi:pimeloyl-ACP methyl ester carboxylesterase
MDVEHFKIRISDDKLRDLRARLALTRWPDPPAGLGWDDGVDLDFLRRLVHHWRVGFDWRAQEVRLNGLAQYIATVDGEKIHYVHCPGRGPDPLPLVITHGWPGSFVELERIIPMLADPGSYGGDPSDAFHVVAPSLPGYGFSPAPAKVGTNTRRIAQLWRSLMLGLGYARFGTQGGDIGAGVSMWLAQQFPDALIGAHLNYIPASYKPHIGSGSPALTEAEQAYLERVGEWAGTEGAYAHLQSTKPQTLSYALTDSPVGLAAWIVEKFRAWSDCDGDVERVFSLETLLTDISVYWFSDAVNASLRLYKENRASPLNFGADERVRTPLGLAHFPHELPTPPRSWVERVFDVPHWTSMPRGGHFAALEQPELLAEDIRAFFRPYRGRLAQQGA